MFKRILFCYPILIALALVVSLNATSAFAAEDGKNFCWKDTSTRVVGSIPPSCIPGYERIGLLCYKQCGKGMKRFGFDCHSTCPSGMRDDGLFCRKSEYGRGVGFPWKFGDALNDDGMKRRCEASHGRGQCEKNGLIFYPKCKVGYKAVGCCICRPTQPNCKALGLGGQLDLSCAKKVEIGAPRVGECKPGEESDGGLCYPKCKAGYDGVGPVCWGKPPKGWVQCGMGAAKDSKTCASIVFGQVSSVGQMAVFVATTVATLGTSTGASAAANTAAQSAQTAGKLAKLKQKFEAMRTAFKAIKDTKEVQEMITTAKNVNRVRKGYNAAKALDSVVTPEDMARVAAQIASIVDPTGVSATVAAYTYPKCSKYFPNQ